MNGTTASENQVAAGNGSRRRAYDGWLLFAAGFRPFFLLGSIQAGLSILVWLPVFHGELTLASALAPRANTAITLG